MEKSMQNIEHKLKWNEDRDIEDECNYSPDVGEDYLISTSNENSKLKSMTNKRELSCLLNSCYLNERKLSHDTNPILPSIISNANNLKSIGKKSNENHLFNSGNNENRNEQFDSISSEEKKSNNLQLTPRFDNLSNNNSSPDMANSINEVKDDDSDEELRSSNSGFKNVVVKDLKDCDNYYKFIHSSRFFLYKIQKDKDWFDTDKNFKQLKSAQSKINKHICLNFDDSFDDNEEAK